MAQFITVAARTSSAACFTWGEQLDRRMLQGAESRYRSTGFSLQDVTFWTHPLCCRASILLTGSSFYCSLGCSLAQQLCVFSQGEGIPSLSPATPLALDPAPGDISASCRHVLAEQCVLAEGLCPLYVLWARWCLSGCHRGGLQVVDPSQMEQLLLLSRVPVNGILSS